MSKDEHKTEKWDLRFLSVAKEVAGWSKDPSTKVGAVLVDDLRRIISTGYNGFPRGVEDLEHRYSHRPTKYSLVVHAEANALLNAVVLPRDATLYCTLHPCEECSKLIVQAGVRRIVVPLESYEKRLKQLQARGAEEQKLNVELADTILSEGGVYVDKV